MTQDKDAHIAKLSAENERLKQETENWKTCAAGWRKIAKASTSAVKVSYANSTAPNRPFATTPPEGQQEPVAWGEFYGGKIATVRTDKSRHCTVPLYARPAEQAVTEALRDLLDHVDRNTCAHEDTYRGGSIWTICDSCGQKWADDRGGVIPYSDPEPVAKARAALKAAMEAGRHD